MLTSDIEFARREAGLVRDFPSPVPAILERAPVVDSNEKRGSKFLSVYCARKPLLTSELVSLKIPSFTIHKASETAKTRRAPKGIKKPPKPAPKPATKPATRPATNLALNTATDSATSSASATTTVSAVA